MDIFSKIFGGSIAEPIDAAAHLAKAVRTLYTTDGEKLDKETILERIKQQPLALQVELNKIEAKHKSVWVAGWRPFIGWICGISLGLYFIPQFVLGSYLWIKICLIKQQPLAYPINITDLICLTSSMLGFSIGHVVKKIKRGSK
jgi:hypothetical protein